MVESLKDGRSWSDDVLELKILADPDGARCLFKFVLILRCLFQMLILKGCSLLVEKKRGSIGKVSGFVSDNILPIRNLTLFKSI